MKKAIALLATLVVLTGTTFAQLAPSISGSAETKWGVNLDANDGDGANGFEMSTDVTVTIPVTSGETVATADAEGVAGVASISGTTLTINLNDLDFDDDKATSLDGFTGDTGSVSAKIDFANGAYMTIGDDTDLAANFAEGDQNYWVNPTFGEDAGTSVGFANDTMSVELTVANETDGYEAYHSDTDTDSADATYEDKTDVIAEDKIELTEEVDEGTTDPVDDDGYVLGAKAMYTAGDIFTLDFQFATNATADGDKTGVAVKVASTPVENVTVTLPFDYLMSGDYTAMELLPTVAVTAGDLTLGADVHYITVAKELVNAGLTTTAALTEDVAIMTLNADVAYSLAAGDATLAIALAADDLLEDSRKFSPSVTYTAATYNAKVATSFEEELGAIEVDGGFTGIENVAVSVETTLQDGDTSFKLDKLNIDYTGIANTTITANYSGFDTDGSNGTFYVGAKITL